MTKYVLVATNPRIAHVGGVWGPFDTKDDARDAKDLLNFPTPEEVLVRPMYEDVDRKERIRWRKVKKFFDSIVERPVGLEVVIKNEPTGKQMTVQIPYDHAIEFMKHVRTDHAEVSRIK